MVSQNQAKLELRALRRQKNFMFTVNTLIGLFLIIVVLPTITFYSIDIMKEAELTQFWIYGSYIFLGLAVTFGTTAMLLKYYMEVFIDDKKKI